MLEKNKEAGNIQMCEDYAGGAIHNAGILNHQNCIVCINISESLSND